jgi:hypothetical protein
MDKLVGLENVLTTRIFNAVGCGVSLAFARSDMCVTILERRVAQGVIRNAREQTQWPFHGPPVGVEANGVPDSRPPIITRNPPNEGQLAARFRR